MRYIVEALDTLTIHRKEMFCEATCNPNASAYAYGYWVNTMT